LSPTRAGISAVVQALSARQRGDYVVRRLQAYHKRPAPAHKAAARA
jgi:hypothetical protein